MSDKWLGRLIFGGLIAFFVVYALDAHFGVFSGCDSACRKKQSEARREAFQKKLETMSEEELDDAYEEWLAEERRYRN